MNLRLISAIVSILVGRVVAQSTTHNFSVKDDIAMVHFSDPSDEQENFDANRVKYSPDGRLVAIVTTRGLLESDQLESTLSIFDLEQTNRFLHDPSRPAPTRHVLAVVTARPHGEQLTADAPMIRDIRWSGDSKHLYFRAMNSRGGMQLDEIAASGGELRRLTPADYSVDRFDVENGTIAYTAARLGQPPAPSGEEINRDALAVTGYRLAKILFPGQVPSYDPMAFVLGVIRPGDDNNHIHQIPVYAVSDIQLLLSLYPFKLSPDGRQLITVMPVLRVPEAWKSYDPPTDYAHFRIDPQDPTLTNPDNGPRPREYSLIDLDTGKITPLVGGPNARSLGYALDLSAIAWASNGTRVLVTNTFLAPDAKGEVFLRSRQPCRLASIDLPSMRVQCLFYQSAGALPDPVHIDAVQFGRDANEVWVTMKSSPSESAVRKFLLQEGAWRSETVMPVPEPGLVADASPIADGSRPLRGEVFIKQSLNDAPALWASDKVTGKSHLIWNPNPQLQHVRIGEASVYRWKDRSGADWIGGLVKPVGYVPGKRYPLVIQMYVFHEYEFLTDGTDPTAFAARELASAGFVVLEVRKKPNVYSEVGPQTHLEGYRSAVQSLSDAGLVDPHKVGVVGFSYTCWYAINALVKAPKLFAAATIADGIDYSYMQYILYGPGPALVHEQMDRVRGGGPFGSTQSNWFKDAPGFHLDQVTAPVRVEAINPTSVLQEWELYSSLYMQHKPVDLIYFPEGTHVHERPLERYESQQGNVDWLRFWLQDYEDPDPVKQAQYRRWEAMKTRPESIPPDNPAQ
jgi:hypothetical protein